MKKVAIFCPFTYPSACGIWSRVYSDAMALKAEGYDVSIFSSNVIKGTKDKSSEFEELDGLKIYRFNVIFSLGGNSMFWNFSSKLRELNPDIVHSHGYRHPHTLFSTLWARFNKKKIFLTTHAPFEKDKKRSIIMKAFDFLYDIFIGKWELKLYTKVIRISNWEEPYLNKLGLKESLLIPNGLNEIFFEEKPEFIKNKFNRVVYMGRIDPVKRPEWLVQASLALPQVNFKLVGPLDGYQEFKSPATNLEINLKRYEPQDFINELNRCDIYVLPSAREAMPFTLLEAMSRGKIVVASPTNGAKEVISNGENGFIIGNPEELIEKIQYIYDNWDELQSIRYNAVEKSKEYSAKESNSSLITLYRTLNV